MSQEPASSHPYAALSLDQIVRLFLLKLYGWLIRCHESGAPFAPADIAQHVTKADTFVHAFIRSRAAAQLEHAGYTFAANAMRDFGFRSREPAVHIEPAQGCHTELSSGVHEHSEGAAGRTRMQSGEGAPASTQKELAQGCAPQTPGELLERLETIISNFERADAIGSALARMIVYTLAMLTPKTRETVDYAPPEVQQRKLGLGPPNMTPQVGRGPPDPWPPPTHTVIPCAVRGAVTLRRHGTFFKSSQTRSRISIAQLRYATHPG